MTYARIGIFETDGAPVQPVLALFRDRVVARFGALSGFLGYQAFTATDDRRFVGISYWSSLEALEASAEVALQAREDAADLGAQTVGEPLITREGFDTRMVPGAP
ncbi:antibiotic biosynthesis monooxygenase [Erythrobacter mangrovi]|uniref:Antibiotic biosynthesis monooxygenase n=1 Tax=Erythrobacter mangrovi TaxID=2739433 RepID=A0A7D3XTX6_9SPHN|nr:antibiotic biosynthesis monooxygenase [Erythrobacter mangrovi]QKG70416.1 antibiotic biosynthesis monooxygenase [Erythrobacter mangrovi]